MGFFSRANIQDVPRKMRKIVNYTCGVGGIAFSTLTLLVWRQEGHLACKKQ